MMSEPETCSVTGGTVVPRHVVASFPEDGLQSPFPPLLSFPGNLFSMPSSGGQPAMQHHAFTFFCSASGVSTFFDGGGVPDHGSGLVSRTGQTFEIAPRSGFHPAQAGASS